MVEIQAELSVKTTADSTCGAVANEYFDQMASALGDKARLADHLVPGTVTDIGAGGGELAGYMASRPHIDHVWAADISPQSLERLRTAYRADDGLTVVEGSFAAAFDAAGGQVDNIMLSSVLHEVYSYAEGDSRRKVERILGALGSCVRALRPGGRLIIRDGIKPVRDRIDIAIDGPGVWEMVKAYGESSPEGCHLEETARVGSRSELVLTADLAAEFLLTATWGADHLHREGSEHYTWAGRDTYRTFVEAIGPLRCELIHYEAYTQNGYREALSDWTITDAETGSPWFPRTNAVWVFEKEA